MQWAYGWLVVLLLAQAAVAQTPLDDLLGRLGLVELRLHRLERALDAETDASKRAAAAESLADQYAEQLIAAADDADRFGRLQSGLNKLLAEFPKAKTPAVEVVLLQADYQRAEALAIRWMEEPRQVQPLSEAAQILGRIAPRLTARRAEIAAAAEAAADSIDSLPTAQERTAAEQRLQKQQALSARAGYFAGWSQYYLGVARQNPALARPEFTAAKEQFLILLDVSDERDYELVEAEGLGLESVWRARATIGLGLAELGLKRTAAAAQVFSWLQQAAVSPQIRDQAAYWQVQGLFNAGLVADAVRAVAVEVAPAGGGASPGKVSIAVVAIRGGAALDGAHAKQRQQLVAEGVRGLARMRQFETLDRLIEKLEVETLLGADHFTLAWLRGRRQYLAAEQSKSPDDFRAAAATLSAALSQPEAGSSLAAAGQARYYLGWCRFRLNELSAAGRAFQESATALRTAAPDLAVQAAWMHATCLVTLAAKDQSQISPAIAALQNFRQDFPASEHAPRAELLITRLRHSRASPAEAIRELAAIPPGDPNYPAAQYEIVQLQHQLWSQVKSEPAKAASLAVELLRAADRFLAAAGAGDDERRLKASLLAIDVLLAGSSPDFARVARLLVASADAAGRADPRSPAAVEYQYRRLQAAQRSGDEQAAREAAGAIARHGGGTPYELPALVIVARAADAAVASAAEGERPAKQDEAAQVYERLVALLGDSPAVLAENKNALAASSKLAQYDEERGRWRQAAERLNRLVTALPKDRRLLRRGGVASFQAGDHAAALDHWRTLLAGVESGSDEWLEAKYYQLACLRQLDPPAAKKVYDQFQLLYPNVPEAWQEKFAALRLE